MIKVLDPQVTFSFRGKELQLSHYQAMLEHPLLVAAGTRQDPYYGAMLYLVFDHVASQFSASMCADRLTHKLSPSPLSYYYHGPLGISIEIRHSSSYSNSYPRASAYAWNDLPLVYKGLTPQTVHRHFFLNGTLGWNKADYRASLSTFCHGNFGSALANALEEYPEYLADVVYTALTSPPTDDWSFTSFDNTYKPLQVTLDEVRELQRHPQVPPVKELFPLSTDFTWR